MLDETNDVGEGAMSSDPAGRSDSLDRGSPEPFRFELEFPKTMKRPEGPVWLIKGLLPATGLAVTYGPSGSGKSFLALDAALHIATLSRYKVIPKTAKVVRQTDLKSFPEIEITATTPASRKARIDTLVRELADRGCIHRHKGYVWFDTPHD